MVRKIVLSIAAVLAVCSFALAQNKQVTGTVTGADGAPVAGATVAVDGTSLGTSTDLQGKFVLEAPADGVLTVSFIGYEDQQVAINGKTSINIVLKESSQKIGDVVVVAFGQTTKEAFQGSAKTIKADDLIKTQSSNVTDALVGKVSGMQMASASGRPGSGQTIRIRGYGSVSSSVGQDPLWVVDGVPFEGDINNINSNDIESITVLKDAASTALYGSRGANGVIMVTTKRAKVGDAMVTFDGKWGVNSKAYRTYDIIENPGEYYEMHYLSLNNYYSSQGKTPGEAYQMSNKTLTATPGAGGVGYNVYTVPEGENLIGRNGKLNPNATLGRKVTYNGQEYTILPDNWLDNLYKTGFRQEYNVSVSAATAKSNFYASLGYLDNKGIIDGSHQDRLTARLRADYQAKKWLKIGGNFSFAHYNWRNGNDPGDEGDDDGGNIFAQVVRYAPIYSLFLRDADGNIMTDKYGFQVYDNGGGMNGGSVRPSAGMSNPLQDIILNKYYSEGNAFSANGFADFLLYKGLKLTINGAVDLDETRSTDMMNPYYGQFATSGGVIGVSHGRSLAYNLQQFLSYNETFADKHNVDIVAGHEYYNNRGYGLGASRQRLFSVDNMELSGAVVDGMSSYSSSSEYNKEGYFIRAQYAYDNRIFASASYRRDASSRFHPDHRWGNFWSVSAAWLINRESWFNASWVDMLKLKASYGQQGNDNIPGYLYADQYSISDDGNGGIATIFGSKGNPNITWETNSNLNVGVEFGFWGNRLSGSVEFFNRVTTDMLFSLPVAPSLGYSRIWTNVGDMLNRGIEIELNADLIRTKNVLWSFGLNMTHFKNKILRLPEEYKTATVEGYTGFEDGSYFRGEGLSLYTFYIPTYAGVNKETGAPQWYTFKTDSAGEFVLDEKGQRIREITESYSEASENGRELHGNSTPAVYGGFNTSLNLYGFDLSIGFTYQIGGKVYDSGYASYMSSPQGSSCGENYHKDLWKSWTPENKNSNIPRLQYDDLYTTSTSSRFLTDASYLNIQNIVLGYTLPQRITRKFLVENLRVYVACDNVWYWSQREGLDPRQGFGGGTSIYYYAPIRTFSGGVTITF